ncbi:predicted protein [Histoplasma mississippiense (nom. inval.)]|uniref:predicted protein n=1 Tax=Ajellomyces capsulatus (strain NAm1 / WU24) TaxID=2059318 RepID=UPI000157D5CD|nr:predicted protein [Histoplasma mississippiense (nom. inval.)]EDN05469.1 predicted protein [Histoplasma mississippiense (nom. inval.)]
MSDQSSLQPPPPGNPRKRRSADNLSSQTKKILPTPPKGASLSDAVHAAPTQGGSTREDIPTDNIISVDNMAKTAVDTAWIFEPSLCFTHDATIAALESIVRCWAPTSGLIPTEDLERWYKGLSADEITALAILAWHFGTDEVGLGELCSFISSLPDDADGLENIWARNRFRQGWNFKTSAEFESMLHTVKAFQHPAFAEIAAQSHGVQKVVESDLQKWLDDFHML